MSRKKGIWFEVAENEQIEECLARMKSEGYVAMGRKEEPLFKEVNGEFIPIRQVIKFKGILMDE